MATMPQLQLDIPGRRSNGLGSTRRQLNEQVGVWRGELLLYVRSHQSLAPSGKRTVRDSGLLTECTLCHTAGLELIDNGLPLFGTATDSLLWLMNCRLFHSRSVRLSIIGAGFIREGHRRSA